MLEYIYDDIVKKFHQQFMDDYLDSDNFLQIEQKLSSARSLVKMDRLEFYLSTFFHHLNIDGTNLEVEIYKKLSADAQGNQQKKTLIRYVNTFNKECLRLENYDFRLLFQKVKPKMLMQMFVSLLHERKIILIHNESSKNAILIEALISLLYPLQWNFTNISYLIPSMVEYLEAPFPYIVGVPRDLWKYVYEQKWDILGEEVVAFDIDNHRYYSKEELPEFPQPYTQLLIKQLEIQLEKSKQCGASSARGTRDEAQKEEEKFWNNFTLKVKQQFLNFLIFLINTFENFYIPSLKGCPSKGNINSNTIGAQGTAPSTIDSSTLGEPKLENKFSNGGSANDIFNFEEYVQNVRENQSFFEKFVRTQAFINFIEQAFYEEQGNLNDASIRFFKECTRKLASENIQAVRTMQDAIIQGLMHKFNNRGISYSIDKCHLLYEKSLQAHLSTTLTQEPVQNFLFHTLSHNKILPMKPFDPRPFIEQRYYKGTETLYDMQERSNKKPKSYYQDILKDMTIEEPPLTYQINNNSVNIAEYFTVQVTPNGDNPINLESLQDPAILMQSQVLSKTTQLIKIEDNMDEISNNSQLVIQQHEHDNDSSEEKGIFGFFKKTFSSVKKTFENTFNNRKQESHSQHRSGRHGVQTPLFENDNELDESPRIQRVQRAQNTNRTARSQTFHVSNYQQERRDRKNNDSFFANLFNMGSNKKELQESQSVSPRKEYLHQTVESKSRLNRSGFFVFNEEDMKKMTEMSPKNINRLNQVRSSSVNFDLIQMESQLSQRQQPQIKSSSIFNNQPQFLSNRIRSISYQQQTKNMHSDNKELRLVDLISESMNHSSIIEESFNMTNSKNQEVTLNNINSNSAYKSPLMNEKDSRNFKGHDRVAQQLLFGNRSDMKVSSFRQTPSQSKQQSATKDNNHKQEFEEIYKKSTENLYFAPTVRSIDGVNKNKYNIWKSQSGKVDLKLGSQKPPKHQQANSKKHHLGSKHSSINKQDLSQMQQPLSVLTKVNKALESSGQTLKYHQRKEEKKALLRSHEGVYSDKYSTDEDQRAPIMGKNSNQFRKMMLTKPFDMNVSGKKSQAIYQQAQKHRRQISTGLGAMKLVGESLQALGSPLLENIDPDDDPRVNQSLSKQIEVMQIGRVRRKSHNKSGQVKAQSRKGSKLLTQCNQQLVPKKMGYDYNIRSSNAALGVAKQQSIGRKQNERQLLKQDSSRLDISSNVREDENDGMHNKINYKHIQAKTVQSSSYSSIQSSLGSHESQVNQNMMNYGHLPKQDSTVSNHNIKYLVRKQIEIQDESNLEIQDDSYFSVQSDSNQGTKQPINIINQSIDLRDSKKGEFLRLRSQAVVVSPQNFGRNGDSSTNNMCKQQRIHSFSQYADSTQMKPLQFINHQSQGAKFSSDLLDFATIRSGKGSQVKPLNKMNWEAFNQIAKLTGDVDHEPSTPKSGANISDCDVD